MAKNSLNKLVWNDDHLKLICGFANARGGKIVIGINSKGNATGMLDIPRLMAHIPSVVKAHLGIQIGLTVNWDNFNKYLEVTIDPSSHPISYNGQYYYRHGNSNKELTGDELDQFLLQKQGRPQH